MYIAKNDDKRPKLTKEVDNKDDKYVYSPIISISDYYDSAPPLPPHLVSTPLQTSLPFPSFKIFEQHTVNNCFFEL